MRHMRFTIHLVQAGGDRGSPGGRRRHGGQRGGGSRANRASGLGAWEAGAREAARLFPLPRTPCSCAPWLQGGEEACEAGACALGCGRCPPSLARWRGEEARAPLFYFFSRVTGGRSSLPPLSHFVLAARRESGACSGEKREARRAARLSVPSSITAIMSSLPPTITPTPVEPCVETEPAYWFRRVGELTFSRPPPPTASAGGACDGPPAPLPGSARRVVAAPTAGVVAFSDGRGERGGVERGGAEDVPMHQPAPFLSSLFSSPFPYRSCLPGTHGSPTGGRGTRGGGLVSRTTCGGGERETRGTGKRHRFPFFFFFLITVPTRSLLSHAVSPPSPTRRPSAWPSCPPRTRNWP